MSKKEEKTEEELIKEFLSDFLGIDEWIVSDLHGEMRELAERMISRGWKK